MATMTEIREFAGAIARLFAPARIVLFGSHARGEETEDSDVDLLVILPGSGAGADRSLDIRLRIPVEFPLDLVTRTEGEVQRRLGEKDWFLHDVLEEGIVLYDRRRARVG
jgi:predicted nucleotidyltransferase